MRNRLSLLGLLLAAIPHAAPAFPDDVTKPKDCGANLVATSPFSSVATGRWNSWALSLSADGKIRFQNTLEGEGNVVPAIDLATPMFLTHHPIQQAAFSPSGQHVAVMFAPDRLRCYDVASGLVRWELGLPEAATGVSYGVSEEERVIVVTANMQRYVYDGAGGLPVYSSDPR